MKIRLLFIYLLLLTSVSCNNSEDIIKDDPVIDDPIVDDKNPELTITGFSEIIETDTKISITIVDDSAVETKLLLNNEELATSTAKQFDLDINPYGLPIGQTNFIIVSKDAMGNEKSETFSVEIKHLLIEYEYSLQELGDKKHWLFFNNLDGTEIKSILIKTGAQKVYTDKIILEDKIYTSKAAYRSMAPRDIKYLEISTFKTNLGGKRIASIESTPQEYKHSLKLKINDVPYKSSPSYFVGGHGYVANSYSGNESYTNITIKHNADRPIYVRNSFLDLEPNLIGKKENYHYLSISPDVGNTSMEVELDQFLPAEENIRIDFPQHDPGSIFFHRNGFKNEENYMKFEGHNIYDVNEPVEASLDFIDMPIISGLNLYQTSFGYKKNDITYTSLAKDGLLNIEMPNWTADVYGSNSTIQLNANNSDVDYYILSLSRILDVVNGNEYSSKAFFWNYNIPEVEDNKTTIVPRLSLPNLINESIDIPFFNSTSELKMTEGVTAIDYTKFNSYDETLEWIFFNINILNINDKDYRLITFPKP